MKLRVCVAIGVMAFSRLAIASDPESPTVPVGAARVDITPDGPIRLSGYLARGAESKGIGRKIWAKALAIGSDEQGPAILVAVDNLGVPQAITSEVAGRLNRRAGLARDRLAIGSSHTHTAPCLTNVAPNVFGKPIPPDHQERIDRYTRGLVDKLEQVCLDALKSRQPGRLAWAQGKLDFAANRRTRGGPVDHSLPVLKVTSADGALRAVVTNYACHCTTIHPDENLVDGDWAGYAQAAIEADHPGCVALTLIGCGADANPTRQFAPGAAAAHGRALADEVNRLLHGSWTELPGTPRVAVERFNLPFDTLPTREQLERLVKAGGPPGYNASTQLARLDRGEPLQGELPYSAQSWRFGDKLLMVFLPGEVVVDYALRLKKEFDPARTWVTAYANDVPCYIPSERILREGGYEGGGAMVYYGRPTRLKPGVERIIIDAVHRVAGPGFDAPTDARASDDSMPPPLSPEESRRAFRAKPGLRVDLVVAEPMIESPIAIDFGADGKLWVCEMRDYPTGLDGNWKPGGVIKVLEDRDGDGRYDKATAFLEGLPFPTGVMAWRKGALICAAPEIIYAEDTDGDGKADVRRTLYQGFSTENYQARVNGLSYGLDNWVYGANGLIGGTIRGTAGGRPVDIGGRDFRFRPDTGEFQPATGLTQQGRVHDDWGNQFGGTNSMLIQHYPMPDHYSCRNPRVAAPDPAIALAREPDPSRLFPASRTLARYNDPGSANYVTSACSPLIYRDDHLGPAYAGNAFTCEPVHNLVRRMVLEPDGVTFAGRRAPDERESEFLASTDNWCRPVQVRTGPDGALWVVDMYRFVIEHPRWISPEQLATLDVRAGADKGRIYRVVPEGRPLRPIPRLDSLSTRELAGAMDCPNGTIRDNVQRLLVHRADRSAAPILQGLARTSPRAEVRAQALATLEGLGALRPSDLAPALRDGHPGVRREAVRLSEPWLGKDADLGRTIVAMVDDPDTAVRYQLALSLGEWDGPETGRALGQIAVRYGADRWIRAAVLSSSAHHAASVLEVVLASSGPRGPSPTLIEPLIATLAASRDGDAIARALAAIGGNGEPAAGRAAWRIGAAAQILDARGDEAMAAEPAIRSVVAAARELADDGSARPGDRATALRLLGRVRTELAADRERIAARLDPGEAVELQLAAIRALTRIGDGPSTEAIVGRWRRLGPSIRAAALNALLERPGSTMVLLSALENGRIATSDIDASHRERLLRHGPRESRERAARAFGAVGIGQRQAVLAAYAGAGTIGGDPQRGKRAFQRACAACHRLEGIGHEVGPDLAALTDLSADAILTAVLDPSREVDARYAIYTAALKDGRVLSGMIAAETANAITLKRQEGQSDVIFRADLEEMTTAGRSLMPEGLENDLSPSDVADLIAFIGGGTGRPKETDGNRPQTVVPEAGGAIRLTATTAEVYGPSLTYEPEFGNLGYWNQARDRAAWTFRVDHAGTFTMSLEWSCDDGSAGNRYAIQVDGAATRGVIAGTGSWASYRSLFLREITLSAGLHRLDMRPDGPIHGALADVRAIVLTPRGAATAGDAAKGARPGDTVDALVRTILDPSTRAARRDAILKGRAVPAAALVAALARSLDADRREEYRRIPWIWQIAVAAGRRNDSDELRKLLEVALPEVGSPLDHWRAVVLGGGLINGISQSGPWPGDRIDCLVRDDADLLRRWHRALDLASAMADDEGVPKGTRYDALRMIGLASWDRRGAQLVRYLAGGIDPELQQGAIGALGDMPSPRAARAIRAGLASYTPPNRRLAIEALARDDDRRVLLLDALEAGQIAPTELGKEAVQRLVDPARNRSHERARRLLAK